MRKVYQLGRPKVESLKKIKSSSGSVEEIRQYFSATSLFFFLTEGRGSSSKQKF